MKQDLLRQLDNKCKKIFRESKWFRLLKGIIATTTHSIIISGFFWASVLSFNVKNLWIFLFGTYLLIAINIIIHNCPLTQIEEEVWGDSIVDLFNRNLPINYCSERKFEVQLQYLFLCSAIIGAKLIFFYLRNELKSFMNIKYT